MSRSKIYYSYEIPRTVVDIVKSICADYDRRAIAMRSAPEGALQIYKYMNDAIDRAMAEIEPAIRRTMLEDIYTGRGYDSSPASAIMSRRPYYARKRKAVHDMALEFHLISE